MTHARPDVAADGEFRVPDDEAVDADLAVRPVVDSEPGRHSAAGGSGAGGSAPTSPWQRTSAWASSWWTALRQSGRPDGGAGSDASRAAVDLTHTPREVVAASAFGVVAVPLLFVYAGLFIVRYFLQPGEQPDITSSWGGEGLAGLVAAVLAIALAVIVGRAVAGRGLAAFVGAELVVAAACGWLLSDSASGGNRISIVVGVVSVIAAVCALLPGSRRWFAAHRAERS